MRDSLIQRFEYSYSLALEMIKRYFILSAFENGNIDGMSFNGMITDLNGVNLSFRKAISKDLKIFK